MAGTALDFTDTVDVTDAANYIPEIWSDQIIAAYKANLVLAGLVSNIEHNGKKGDIIHLPKFTTYLDATAKVANTVVDIQTQTDTEVQVTLNKHYERSYVREDIAELQAIESWRASFADRAGYGLSRQIENDIRDLAATWNSGTNYSGAFIGSDGATAWDLTGAGNGTAFTDAGLRRAIQRLDDSDVPMVDRYLLIPPVEKRKLLDIPKLVEQAFVGEAGDENSIRNGFVGDIYGTKVYMSTNVKEIESADSTDYRVCLMFQKQALVLAIQQAVRFQEQYKLEALGTLVVADVVYGTKTLREEGCDAYIVPSA